jgi:hypothetical protein
MSTPRCSGISKPKGLKITTGAIVDATATSPPKCSQGRARIEGGTVSPSAFAVLRFPLECGWLLDWQISRLCALQDTSGVNARLAIEAASSIP